MKIDIAIRMFADFLNCSWTIVSKLPIETDNDSYENSINNWLQANWELLVERKVLKSNEYLEVYGDGADYNGSSSRMSDPEALPTFKIIIKSKKNSNISDILNNEKVILENASFDKIVGFRNGFYILEPEFKYVLILDYNLRKERVVALGDIEFELERL